MLKTKVKILQSKKAWTQYITIPAAMVQDSQYPFQDGDELYVKIEPFMGIMIISKDDKPLDQSSKGILIRDEDAIPPEQTTLIKTSD